MEARLTEFSYGYCVTEELANQSGSGFKAAPYFPSLYSEGKTGGGFDVQIGSALFLQFKLSEELTRRSAKETQKGLLEPTFFRFWLQRRDRSAQHKMLIELERQGSQVFYIAPEFADINSLDQAYNGVGVVTRSAMFSPTDIGPLPDDKYHSVAFKADAVSGWFLSDPKPVKLQRSDDLVSMALRGYSVTGPRSENASNVLDWLSSLAGQMKQIVQHNTGKAPGTPNRLDRGPLEDVAYLARTHFGCELFLFANRRS
jgi:hypothetical protein